MIESLSVTNFYCFKERTSILFTAKKERKRNGDPRFCGFTTQNKVNILKLVYLLGNNGSGKSKMLYAFDALQYLITQVRGQKDDLLSFAPFAFDDACQQLPSVIEIVYHLDNVRYAYQIKWNKYLILDEELKELRPKSEVVLFHRWHDVEFNVVRFNYHPSLKLDDNEAYLLFTSVLGNNSILSTVITTNLSNQGLNQQFYFFKNGFTKLDIHDTDLYEELPDDKTEHDKKLKKVITTFLQSVDTNIMSYEKIKVDVEYPSGFLQKMKTIFEDDPEKMQELLRLDRDRHTVNTFHRLEKGATRRGRLSLSEQSDGTKEILRMLIVLNEAIQKKKTIILDDYSSGIQRNTLNQLIRFFIAASSDSQLIISTQDYGLLDFDIVRRDSIRFLVKDDFAEAHVESIDLSKLHKNSSLHHYVSKMNVYKQLPEMNEELFNDLLNVYAALDDK